MKYFICILLLFSVSGFGQKKIKYRYKKHENFDFSALNVEGTLSSPGDLSIGNRFRQKFRNKIPERKNFNKELRKNLDIIR